MALGELAEVAESTRTVTATQENEQKPLNSGIRETDSEERTLKKLQDSQFFAVARVRHSFLDE